MIQIKNVFYTSEMGDITFVADGKFYLILGDSICLTENYVPALVNPSDIDEFVEYLSGCYYSDDITLNDIEAPWLEEGYEILLETSDIDINNAISCDELWDATRKYFDND